MKSFVIKCPFGFFCTDFPQKSRLFRVESRVSGWNPAGPWEGANVSKCLGRMQRTIPSFRFDDAPKKRFIPIPPRRCWLGCASSLTQRQLSHHANSFECLISALVHANVQLAIEDQHYFFSFWFVSFPFFLGVC